MQKHQSTPQKYPGYKAMSKLEISNHNKSEKINRQSKPIDLWRRLRKLGK